METKAQYLDYDKYRWLGGSLDITPFNLLEFEARKVIDKHTFGRLSGLNSQSEEVELCMFKLISVLNSYNESETHSSGIVSESTDGYSVTYATATSETKKAKNEELKNIVVTYLCDSKLTDGTPYLYRGV